LLDDGNCKVNALVEDGDDEWHVRKYSPLSQASDPAIIKILLEAKANVNPKKGDCALRGACTMLRPDAVKMLIDAGANVNATARGGMTPLLYALEAKCAVEQADDIIQVVKLLLDAGAKTFGAIPPLHKCTNPNEPRRLGALKVLLERDQSMAYDVDASGRNVIMCAAMSHTKSPSALSVLIDAGVDLNDLGHKDKPALFYVFRYLDKVWKGMRLPRHVRDCLQMLLRAGADPTILDGDWTLLMDLLGYEDPYMFYANVFTDNTMRILISDIADSILQRPVGSDVKKSADTALDTDSAKTSLPVVSENADDSSSEENEQLRRKRFKSAKQ
jgi:ankyrin repeat protein